MSDLSTRFGDFDPFEGMYGIADFRQRAHFVQSMLGQPMNKRGVWAMPATASNGGIQGYLGHCNPRAAGRRFEDF